MPHYEVKLPLGSNHNLAEHLTTKIRHIRFAPARSGRLGLPLMNTLAGAAYGNAIHHPS